MRRTPALVAILAAALAAGCGGSNGGSKDEKAGGGGGPPPPPPVVGPIVPQTDSALAELAKFIGEQEAGGKIDRTKPDWKTRLPKPPQATFDASKTYFWDLVTNKGPIRVRLMPKIAPMHVSSLSYLTLLGYYDGLTFHRVIPGFMAQGGDPVGNGSGSPGYEYEGEFDPLIKHDREGILSAAHRGPGTDGSQFFLTFAPTPHLDRIHTVYGEVVAGLETLKALERAGTRRGDPTERLVIEKATVTSE